VLEPPGGRRAPSAGDAPAMAERRAASWLATTRGVRSLEVTGLRSRAEALAWLAVIALCLGGALLYGPVPERTGLRLGLLVAAGAAWWRALVVAGRSRIGRGELVAGLLLLHGIALAGRPELSDDVYRCVWEGEVLARGGSPYAFAPDAPELTALRSDLPGLHARVNNPEIPAIYPPLSQLASLAAVEAGRVLPFGGEEPWRRAVLVVRLLVTACDLALLVPLLALLRRAGRPAGMAAAWAWSPLVALEFAGSGHLDALGILSWVLALAVFAAGRGARGGALAVAAGLVKYLPLASLPFALRELRATSRKRAVLAALVVAMAGFAPLFFLRGDAAGLFVAPSEYGLRWESASLLYRFVEAPLARFFERDLSASDPRRLGRLIAAAAWAAVGAYAWLRGAGAVRASYLLAGGFLLLSPTLHPWYLAWIAPFLALYPARAWRFLLAAAPLAYWPLARWQGEGVWIEPAWWWPAVGLPFLALLLASVLRPADPLAVQGRLP
jgi:hypothetical protein